VRAAGRKAIREILKIRVIRGKNFVELISRVPPVNASADAPLPPKSVVIRAARASNSLLLNFHPIFPGK